MVQYKVPLEFGSDRPLLQWQRLQAHIKWLSAGQYLRNG